MSSEGKYLGTLQSFSKNKLLQLESNSSLAATENVSNLESPYVYFYVESDTDFSAEQQRSQFKPYTKPDTYIAVVNGEIALKKENECTVSERTFYHTFENEDYLYFFAEVDGTTYYLYCDETSGVLKASTTKQGDLSWFRLQRKDKEIVIIDFEHELFVEGDDLFYEKDTLLHYITDCIAEE